MGACDQPAALAYPPGELEANHFAAAMLMPARHLRSAGINGANELAERCAVSVAAAEKRLEYLEWLTGRTRTVNSCPADSLTHLNSAL
jgi:Zn-dependent peptidase ImmA (M78 family)